MKTTIYELLGMIKDGKAPKKIMYKGTTWEYKEDEKDYSNKEWNEWLFDVYLITEILNDYIEILETTITYKQDDYIQYQPYTGEVEIKCNSAKNLWESDKTYKPDKIEKLEESVGITTYDLGLEICNIKYKINEIIEVLNER